MESIDILLETTREFLHQIAAFMPRLLLAMVVVIIGWLVARVVRYAVEKGLRAANFNVLSERSGVDNFLQQGGMRGDTVTLFGLVGFWVTVLISLLIAFNGLGLTYITDLLSRAVMFTPKVVVAMLIVLFGTYFAGFVGNAIHTYCVDADIPDADILGRVAKYLIVIFIVMIALTQVEIGGDIVQKTFLIILAGIVFALALAFGLGGRTWAASLLERWWPQHRKDRKDGST